MPPSFPLVLFLFLSLFLSSPSPSFLYPPVNLVLVLVLFLPLIVSSSPSLSPVDSSLLPSPTPGPQRCDDPFPSSLHLRSSLSAARIATSLSSWILSSAVNFSP